MRVKRLEIQGFKSFKDKTVIHFDHSITGIVGPNGCGKSNIVDAFFWVMGEQSYKHMRGNSSEDLIFNGSSKYSPLGMAEATLVMETEIVDTSNEPAGATVVDSPTYVKTKEISVTRRLYRTGEGEYLVNGTLARLKDIQELFMDTGVGAKGYSVIEQGQIGKIVNAKPEERRLLVEEAAGIAKYKARKKESLRKMEATQANLARLTDIIQEIEKSLGSLERQAQKAQLYKKYKDELLDKEMTWGRRKCSVYREKLETLKNQRDALEQELVGMKAELQTAENSIEIDRIQLLTNTKDAETLQAQIQDLSQELSEERSALELSRRRQEDLASQLLSLKKEKEELQTAIAASTEQLEINKREYQEIDQLFHSAAEEAKEANNVLLQARQSVQQARSELDSNQRKLMSGIHQISEMTSKAAALMSKAESARAQAERLTQQSEAQNEKHQSIEEELAKAQETLRTLQEQRDSLQIEKKTESAKLQDDERTLREIETERNHALKALTQLKSKLNSLEELNHSHEGLADGPKSALDWAQAQGHEGVLTAFTDLLEVTPGYETALETWLESRIESLFTENPSVATSAIEQIRNDKHGRVCIQLLTGGTNAQGSQKKSPEKPGKESFETLQALLEKHQFKVLGVLSSFVKPVTDGKHPYENSAISAQLERVCVVESSAPLGDFLPDFLKNVELTTIEGWSLVTLDGMALEASGILRGGSSQSTGAIGILRRKNAIEELKKQAAEADAHHQTLEEKAAELKEAVEITRDRFQSLQSELQTCEVQLAARERDVHQTERALKDSRSSLESLLQDVEEMNLEAENALTERESINEKLQEHIATRSELEESISSTEGELLAKEEVLSGKDSDLQALRIKEASLRERSNSLKREQEATRSLISDRERRVSEVEKILNRATQERESFTGGESQLEERIEELVLTLSQLREQLATIKDQIEQGNAKVNSLMERTKGLHKSGDRKTSEFTQLALEIEKLSGDLTHLIQNLEEKYGPGCLDLPSTTEEASNDPAPVDQETADPASVGPAPVEMTPEEELALSEEVERLRERIRRLGEVNMMAIEEFNQLKERYDHLLTEKSDLEHSLKNLEDAIEHINKTSEERFKKAFEAIAERFERLFPIIFGGGQAKLSLVYPEGSSDILDAGVDILAQPPGKKVANITLLSGGEKALTAVSLIFAIFMVKPSPFCVLDEVDAPLDDANIGKFNALLREMSVKSQFILITHNKKTMELNDTLYGVTMEEPGVSKMVSIEMH